MNEIKEKFNNVIDSGGINEIYIGPEEEAPVEAKINVAPNENGYDELKYRNPETGELDNIYLEPTGDTFPIGGVIDYDGDTVPTNWELVEDMNIVTDGEPVKTGRKIDGKDEYIKRITFGTLPNNTYSDINTGLSNIDVVDVTGKAYNSTNGLTLCTPYLYSGVGISMQIRDYGSTLRVLCSSDNSAYTGYFNLYFTYNEEVTTNED